MSKQRNWLLILLPFGLLFVTILPLWVFMSVKGMKPQHPNAESVPSVMRSAPFPEWADTVEKTRQIVRASVAEQNLPGLSVAVGIDGEIVWAEGFGFADIKSKAPVTPDHRFRIGTASTVLTSAAAGLLVENGKLKLDDEIQTYVPGFPKKQQPVTLRQLMGHTPGVTPDDNDEAPLFTKHCERPVEAVQHFKNWLFFEPQPQNRHSIYDWIVVSAAIEAAAGQPFLEFMRERVFDPLGMRDTAPDDAVFVGGDDFPPSIMLRELFHAPVETPDATADSSKDRPTFYAPKFAADPNYGIYATDSLDYSCYAGSSGFVSTPSDLVRFGMAIHNKLLKPATLDLLQNGLGWELKMITLAGRQTRVVGYDGDSPDGMVAPLMTFPEYGIVVAVTSNISSADTAAIGLKIAEAFVARKM